jgi:hypothetical protein
MKKLFYLLVVILIFSCSSPSSDDNNSSNFNPPSWIQGTWKDNASFGFKFTSNNVCQLISTNQNCFKEMIDYYNASIPNSATVEEETISETEYEFSYTVSGVTQYFHFIKLSNTSIEYNQPSGINPIYVKQ